jgi:putative oxidoreductase
MNIALWIAQGLLAAMYLMVGSMKVFQPVKVRENPRMIWAHGQADQYIRFVGTVEVLGALGLILPLVTGILPWLTVLAAIGLTLIQLLDIFREHLPKREYDVIPLNIVLLALSIFVVVGRWPLLPSYI